MPKDAEFNTRTVQAKQSVVDSKLKPDAEMHVLVGGPYTSPDGEEHRYGHTALRVKTRQSDITYDFGRYGRTSGTFGESGEGILRKWIAFDHYIRGENSLHRKTTGFVYAIFQYQADAINSYFDKQIAAGQALPDKSNGVKKTFKLKSDYHALGPNCTTLSVDGAKVAITDFDRGSDKYIRPEEALSFGERIALKAAGGSSRLFLPANLQHFLSDGAAHKAIRIDTYGSGK
ncbi:hypothetical protein [Herbaspirillum huttiense]|uniref:hypothetical protein n=1 Tax=Herbaspirillum huttiense TaxID=863372 RepID=UPI0039AEC8D9